MRQVLLIGTALLAAFLVIGATLHLVARQAPAQVLETSVAQGTERTREAPAKATSKVAQGVQVAPQATPVPHSIGWVSITPSTISAGASTTVVVTVQINDPAVIRNSVNLLDVPSIGSPQIIGTMNDDGQNGDLVADDDIFTISTSFGGYPIGVLNLRISAAFTGSLLRIQSGVFQLNIESPTITTGWSTLTDSQHLFSIEIPPQWGLVVVETPGDAVGAVKLVHFEFPDGTIAFTISVYAPSVWAAIQTSDGGPVPGLIGQTSQYVFGESEEQDSIGGESVTQDQLDQVLPQVFATFKAF